MSDEKETVKDFLLWCRLACNVQLQEMPEWTEDYYGVDENQLIEDYLEALKEIQHEHSNYYSWYTNHQSEY